MRVGSAAFRDLEQPMRRPVIHRLLACLLAPVVLVVNAAPLSLASCSTEPVAVAKKCCGCCKAKAVAAKSCCSKQVAETAKPHCCCSRGSSRPIAPAPVEGPADAKANALVNAGGRRCRRVPLFGFSFDSRSCVAGRPSRTAHADSLLDLVDLISLRAIVTLRAGARPVRGSYRSGCCVRACYR